MYSRKQYFVGFILLLSTALSSWLVLKSATIPSALNQNDNSADSYMTNVNVMRTNSDNGQLQDQVYAATMTHFPDNTTLFNTPHFVFYHTNTPPWNLTAKQGKAENGVDLVQLWNQVVLAQAGGSQNQPITINTSQITVYPKQHFAQTQDLVTATEPGVYVTAIGMHVNFQTQIVDLLSHVQVVYKAQNNSKPLL